MQRQRAMEAAEEAEFILRLAELSPADDDPAGDHPGARRESWRTEPEFPGVSEFFVHELAMALNVGRGDFPIYSRDPHCTTYCDYKTICRIAQARSITKTLAPPTLSDSAS